METTASLLFVKALEIRVTVIIKSLINNKLRKRKLNSHPTASKMCSVSVGFQSATWLDPRQDPEGTLRMNGVGGREREDR